MADAARIELSEAADDVLDSLTRMHVASCAELAGDTGRTPTEVRRALRELGSLVTETAGRYALRKPPLAVVEDTDADTDATLAAPDDEETIASRVLALVTESPGLSTQQVSDRLLIEHKQAAHALQRGPYRRERERRPDAAGGRGNTIARWFVNGPAPGARGRRHDGSPLRDQLVAAVLAQPGITLREARTSLPQPANEKAASVAIRTAVRMGLVRAQGHTTLRRYYPPEDGSREPMIPDPSDVGKQRCGPTSEPSPALAVEGPVGGPAGAEVQHVTATRAAPVPTDPDGSGDLVLDAWRERCLAAEARARAAEDRAAEPDPLADLVLLTSGTANQRHIEAALRLAYQLGRASR